MRENYSTRVDLKGSNNPYAGPRDIDNKLGFFSTNPVKL
jgi:hypothetical protein